MVRNNEDKYKNVSNNNHNLRRLCGFLAQNDLISPWATFDTIVMSYLPTLKWNKLILTFDFENNAAQ